MRTHVFRRNKNNINTFLDAKRYVFRIFKVFNTFHAMANLADDILKYFFLYFS